MVNPNSKGGERVGDSVGKIEERGDSEAKISIISCRYNMYE